MPAKLLQRRHVDALVAIGEHRSVHSAARSLGMAQPALSRLLSEAESLVGTRLFERSSQGSRPTPQGELVLSRARALQRGLQRLGEALDQPAQVRIGCIARAMHTLVPRLLDGGFEARSAQPAYQVKLVESSSTALLGATTRGELDFAVLKPPAEGPGGPSAGALRLEPLYDERTVIVCSAGNTAIPPGPVPLALLGRQEWVLPEPGTASRVAFDTFCDQHRLGAVRPVTETRSFETSVALVSHTRFLSVAPESIARRQAALGALRVIKTRHALPSSPVTLAYLEALRDDPVLEAFRLRVHEVAALVRAELRRPKGERGRPQPAEGSEASAGL
jgi:DNA-binding transcriptional LysR family regulator